MMKRLIKLNYHSVFKYEHDQESFKYNDVAYLEEKDERTVISFDQVKIVLKDNEVILHNANGILRLKQGSEILNHYQVPYGTLELKARLISYETGDSIKIKYELYDGINLLSRVYILIKYQILEN